MFTEDKRIFLILKNQYIYRYKLYFDVMYTVVLQTSLKFKEIDNLTETKLVSSSGCNMKSYILNYSRLFRQKK